MKYALVVRFVKSWRHHFYDVISGKIDDLTSTAKSDVNINRFWSEFQNIFYYCFTVFRESCNSWNIQKCRQKFEKMAYFCKISQFCFDFFFFFFSFAKKKQSLWFENKIIFCNQHERFIPRIHFLCLSVHFRFKSLLLIKTKTSIPLDISNRFQWNFIIKVMRTPSYVLWQKWTTRGTGDFIEEVVTV